MHTRAKHHMHARAKHHMHTRAEHHMHTRAEQHMVKPQAKALTSNARLKHSNRPSRPMNWMLSSKYSGASAAYTSPLLSWTIRSTTDVGCCKSAASSSERVEAAFAQMSGRTLIKSKSGLSQSSQAVAQKSSVEWSYKPVQARQTSPARR
jgi:hypothetical protein